MSNLFKDGNMADFLNKILSLGDKIEVLSGDEEIEEGSYVYASDNFVVWADDNGHMNTSNLNNVTVRKV
ncbi:MULTISPECIES: hypothetical protein [Rossellomorea]|jgi:hypothetical protein|uniref:Uncharacterized protein n=1 Tax=Rossellomorea aquimaris TaxID=189382 RepID=A0A366F0Y5_9BACI|nr:MULTISPECIES: hypothetical protein [Rossellomorea]MDT9027430.1 hypothetical protein [Rossellomorea sp. YC4-1]RBP07836.1 hypothetical protein DET59_101204 [Rossellomorea aquimaris]TYS78930.1 hypothetical protein FZD05_10395 [Rossellomorea aquimaris]TYS84676.1 hypothetical protein FZC85_15025 [Rossellomorea aquimaris]TYS91406.1 hypothetical protein FZC88_04475 [Rossellomorea aquimaris]